MSPPRIDRLALVASLLLAAVIAVLTLMPAPALPQDVPGSDKLYHFIAFAALVVPVTAARPRAGLWAVPLAIVYGGAIELIQPHFGRSAEWADLAADAAGALAGGAAGWALHVWLLRPLWRRWHRRRAGRARPAPPR